MGGLQSSHGRTGLVAVVDLLFVMVEWQIFRDACLVEGCENDFLLFGREGQSAATKLEVVAAAKLYNQRPHKGLILPREHPLLETREPTSIHDRLCVAIEYAIIAFRTFPWIDEPEVCLAFLQLGIGYLMQAGCCHRAVLVLADGIVRWQGRICLPWHSRLSVS